VKKTTEVCDAWSPCQTYGYLPGRSGRTLLPHIMPLVDRGAYMNNLPMLWPFESQANTLTMKAPHRSSLRCQTSRQLSDASFIHSFIHQGQQLAVGSLSTCLSAYRQRW